jgi:nucleotide-binding universal stress UspA family protein
MKILLAADGSEFTSRAARYLVDYVALLAKPPAVHVFTVHTPIPYAGGGKNAVHDYHEEECLKALAVAQGVLTSGGVPFTSSWVAGEPGKEIAAYAEANATDLIVMGSHGHGKLRTLAMGSVADDVLRNTKVPVLIVR